MKKTILVIALAAMVLAPVAAFEFKSVGIEADLGMYLFGARVVGTFEFDKKNDGTISIGGGMSELPLAVDLGYNYKVAEFKIDKAEFDVKVGAEAGIQCSFSDGFTFVVKAAPTAAISYDFQKAPLTAYLKLAPGVCLGFNFEYEDEPPVWFMFCPYGRLGLTYNF